MKPWCCFLKVLYNRAQPGCLKLSVGRDIVPRLLWFLLLWELSLSIVCGQMTSNVLRLCFLNEQLDMCTGRGSSPLVQMYFYKMGNKIKIYRQRVSSKKLHQSIPKSALCMLGKKILCCPFEYFKFLIYLDKDSKAGALCRLTGFEFWLHPSWWFFWAVVN
jgi:hypothetical protein